MFHREDKWANRFTIRPSTGGTLFQANLYEYEWHVISSVNPDAYQRLSYPWGSIVPIQLRGTVADSQATSVKVEIPKYNELTYPQDNTWVITPQTITMGMKQVIPAVSDGAIQNVAASETWKNSLYHILQDGQWMLTTMYQLPQDPASGLCPLPIRITVTAQDGLSVRVYYIHAVGSNKRSCARAKLPDAVYMAASSS